MAEMETPATEIAAVPLLTSRRQQHQEETGEIPSAVVRPRTTTMLSLLLGLFAGRRGASMLVRQTAARQLEDWREDWGYSLPVVALDTIWNLLFVVVSVVMLLCYTARERPTVPLRVWICVYAVQCVVHVVLVWLEFFRRRVVAGGGGRRRTTGDGGSWLGSDDGDGSDEDLEDRATDGDAIRWESFNTIVCYMWWVVGFLWLISDFKILLRSAPRLFWPEILYKVCGCCSLTCFTLLFNLPIPLLFIPFLFAKCETKRIVPCHRVDMGIGFFPDHGTAYCGMPDLNFATLFPPWLVLAFLAVDVFFAFIAFFLACLIGLAVCFCFPCIIAILCIIAGQGAASEEDISVLPRYRFKASSNEEQSEVGAGIMIPIETNGGEFSVERLLLAEDADCCICLSPYEDGAELISLFCSHHFHATCITKWLKMNATCPLCKHTIKPTEQV